MKASTAEMKVTALAPTFRAINGSAQQMDLPAGLIQCCITSPPYWGLRSYSTHPQIWGGSADCAHEWGDGLPPKPGRGNKPGEFSTSSLTNPHRQDSLPRTDTAGQFCDLCGAWRGEYGSEPTPEMYVAHTVEIFREVRRVLRNDGVLWLNIGDCYASKPPGCKGVSESSTLHGIRGISKQYRETLERGHGTKTSTIPPGYKPKDLIGIPWLVAFALRADGWWLRDTIIWHKPNPMPSSVTDRTTTAHEYVFLLTKSARYFYDADAIREPVTSTGGASFGSVKKKDDGHAKGPNLRGIRRLESEEQRNHPLGRNKRSVWTIPTQSFHGAHFATFPMRLVEPMIRAGTSERGCCPTCGAPWKRVVEKTREPDPTAGHSAMRGAGHFRDGSGPANREGRVFQRTISAISTWLQSCKCPAHEPIPCTVLDPFAGAFTTAVVAKRLRRSFIGVELNPEYLAMGVKRFEEDKPKPARPRRIQTTAEMETLLIKWQTDAESEVA